MALPRKKDVPFTGVAQPTRRRGDKASRVNLNNVPFARVGAKQPNGPFETVGRAAATLGGPKALRVGVAGARAAKATARGTRRGLAFARRKAGDIGPALEERRQAKLLQLERKAAREEQRARIAKARSEAVQARARASAERARAVEEKRAAEARIREARARRVRAQLEPARRVGQGAVRAGKGAAALHRQLERNRAFHARERAKREQAQQKHESKGPFADFRPGPFLGGK